MLSMVISLLSLLFPLTFGKDILMSSDCSVAPFKGARIPEYGKFRNAELRTTACNPKSKTVLHILTLGRVQPSC